MSWIQTYSGRAVDLGSDLLPAISLLDVAHGLSNLCRFCGQARTFYSVAQHSLVVSREAPHAKGTAALWGLVHDAGEAYMGDLPAPWKETAIGAAWRAMEDRFLRAVLSLCGLPQNEPEAVRQADLIALATERRDLMASGSGAVNSPWRGRECAEVALDHHAPERGGEELWRAWALVGRWCVRVRGE